MENGLRSAKPPYVKASHVGTLRLAAFFVSTGIPDQMHLYFFTATS
jgi:hypothetical protein